MKIEGSVTFLVNRDYSEIEIHDTNASTCFCKIRITPEQLSAMLSRQGYVRCEISVDELHRVGKKHEHKLYEFEIGGVKKDDEETLYLCAVRSLSEDKMSDWTPDKYFRSQNSFFTKDGKEYARCKIRRWS